MRLVARHASVGAHWRMLEGEWASLVRVALEAARLVQPSIKLCGSNRSAVRVVAVGAGHAAFGHLVAVGALELGPGACVAPDTVSGSRHDGL